MKKKEICELILIRDAGTAKFPQDPENSGINGVLFIKGAKKGFKTLENFKYLIAPGRYKLRLHPSGRFNRDLPELIGVPATKEYPTYEGKYGKGVFRTYILIHGGSLPRHSHGCILLTCPAHIDKIVQLIETYEEVYLTVINGDTNPNELVQPKANP